MIINITVLLIYLHFVFYELVKVISIKKTKNIFTPKTVFLLLHPKISFMKRLVYIFLILMTSCGWMTSCNHTSKTEKQVVYQNLLNLIGHIQNNAPGAIDELDSLNNTSRPIDKHERMLRELADCWASSVKTNKGINDSIMLPIIKYMKSNGSPREKANTLMLYAGSLERENKLEEAQKIYHQALHIAEESGDRWTVMKSVQMLGHFYALKTGLKGEASKLYHRFLQLAEESENTDYQAMGNWYIGRLYMISHPEDSLFNLWEEGIDYYQKAIGLAVKANDKHVEMMSKYEMALLLMDRQKPYQALKLFNETKDYCFKNNPDYKQPIIIALIQNYLQLDMADSAQVIIDEAFTLPDRNNLRSNIYDLLFQYYKAKQQYKLAVNVADSMRYYQLHNTRLEISTRAAEFKEKYNNERLINEKQRLKLDKAETQRMLFIITICLIIIIAIVAYLYQKCLVRKETTIRKQSEQLQNYMLQLHEYEKRFIQNQNYMNELKEQIADQKGNTEEIDSYREQIDNLQAENSKLSENINTLQQHIAEYTSNLDKARREAEKLRNISEENLNLKQRERVLTNYVVNNDGLVKELKKKCRILNDNEWESLEQMCESTYGSFVNRLQTICPTLTNQELHLCILIKLRFSNTQMSEIFGVSTSSVSQKKFRLKKHLSDTIEGGLSEEMTLDRWVTEF